MKNQNGIVINKGAAEKSAEKDNVDVAGTTSFEKPAETTTVTAKAGAASVTTTASAASATDEKKADVAVRKEGDRLTITAGAGGNGGDAIVTVNTGAIDIKA